MNSDVGVIKASSTSVWLTTFVINELPQRLRFLPENVIIVISILNCFHLISDHCSAGITNSMTIDSQIDFFRQAFDTISYPSITYRQPQNIRPFKKFKEIEFRIFFLWLFDISKCT
ncbi:unnamed protein product [Adineta steineri]|uniref:Uncharacterized protein n=1 Tax=Adineta steineri TaxID=433720 RepID=A0A819XS29_9BILA|nr:unnamed protein product [Adineta steineri]